MSGVSELNDREWRREFLRHFRQLPVEVQREWCTRMIASAVADGLEVPDSIREQAKAIGLPVSGLWAN